MEEKLEGERKSKGEQTRQRILDSALRLFGSRGYDQTTMRDIASEAGYSPGLTYRYFSSKEELVLGLYQKLCEQLEGYARNLQAGSLHERFYTAVSYQLELMDPHREALSALFGTALDSRSSAGVFSENTAGIRRNARRTYLGIIVGSKDTPKPSIAEDLATLLYGVHLAMVLFWLIDESKGYSRSHLFLGLLRDILKLAQPILWLPPVSQLLSRFASIVGPLLGDERKT